MKRHTGLSLARRFRDLLIEEGIPVQHTLVFGSVARDEATADSDLDVAVVCAPFLPDRMEETMALWRARRQIDLRIEPVCLHPDDFENTLFGLAQEVRRSGVEV
jgi:predicted nucleotidyltransferase